MIQKLNFHSNQVFKHQNSHVIKIGPLRGHQPRPDTNRLPSTVKWLAGITIWPYVISWCRWLAMWHHVWKACPHADVVVQLLGRALRPSDHLFDRSCFAPTFLIRIKYDVVYLKKQNFHLFLMLYSLIMIMSDISTRLFACTCNCKKLNS